MSYTLHTQRCNAVCSVRCSETKSDLHYTTLLIHNGKREKYNKNSADGGNTGCNALLALIAIYRGD